MESALPPSATCPLCERSGARQAFLSRDRVHLTPGIFGVHHCESCDAYFIQPWLSAAELARYYPQEYGRYRHGDSLNQKNYQGWQRFILENYYGYPARDGRSTNGLKRALAWALSFVTAKEVMPYHGAGKILDIGCGGGGYLYRLKQWGWDTYGVEPSEIGVKQARTLGLNVAHGMVEDAHFESDFFDVIRLSNVVEHLPQPKETFREIQRILKPQGIVYLTVPNTRSLVFWLFRKNWYALDAPRHVISYSPKTLRRLAEATGFMVAAQNYSAGPFNFVRSIKYLLEEEGEKFPAWMEKLKWDRSKFIRRVLKPPFFVVDALGYGDFLHATLWKRL